MHQFLSLLFKLAAPTCFGNCVIVCIPRSTLKNQKPKSSCNSEGTDDLPEDGTHLPKHVGAAK
jgi:hypothetical protein